MDSISSILLNSTDDLFASPLLIDDKKNTETSSSPEASAGRQNIVPTDETIPQNSLASFSSPSLKEVRSMIEEMKDRLDAIVRYIDGGEMEKARTAEPDMELLSTGERMVEGVFTGDAMMGSDGKSYRVPANYASKSKLVEGDIMKLTITKNGSFIFKQIGPIGRKRLVGELVFDNDTAGWHALFSGKSYRILTASVTFYKGKSGDEVVFLVPEDESSMWGAVENIINKKLPS